MFARTALVLPLILAACGSSVGADRAEVVTSAPLIYAAVGTEITLANTTDGAATETIVRAANGTGLRGAFIRSDGTEGHFYPGCWGCGAPSEIEEALYAALWPLETGKRVAFLRTAPDGAQSRIVITVEGPERISTRAGLFDTWRLNGRLTSLGGTPFAAQVVTWWAPDPGWIVKAVGNDSSGRLLTSEVTRIVEP